jgi:recombination associated protein RdgC
MWFKNLLVYRLTNWTDTAESLQEKLAKLALQSCNGLDVQNRGWVSPKDNSESLVETMSGTFMIALGVEKKLLPASVINQVAKARAAEIEEQQGYKPGRKQMKEIKEAVTDELIPRAFAIRRKTHVWIDPEQKWMVVDAANVTKADEVTEMLIKSLDNYASTFLRTQISPCTAMTEWLAGGEVPAKFTVDQDCELRGRGESGATIRYVRHALDDAEVVKHIQSGKEVTRLAMTWDDKLSFVLHDNLQIKRLAPLDIIKEQARQDEQEDAFDTDFALMTGELRKMLGDIVGMLGGEVSAE